MRYLILIHHETPDAWWGECPALPGCFSQGDSVEELMENMKEAISLYLEDVEEPPVDSISEVRELVL